MKEEYSQRMDQLRKSLNECFFNSGYLMGTVSSLEQDKTDLITSLNHCINAIASYEKDPGGNIKGFLLGAMDHAKKTIESLKEGKKS